MTRYQITYIKRGVSLTVWVDDKDNAKKMADSLRKGGYIVDVWAHTQDGARKTGL